jgi:ADP-heptose:LPS heptosyltransferase
VTTGPLLVVLRALGLGDFLTGVPALRALRVAFPDHHRVLVTPRSFAPLVQREHLADRVVHGEGLGPIDAALGSPDVAVDLHGRGPGSQPLLLALRPRRLVAFAHPDLPQTRHGPRWWSGEHEVTRWCRLLVESGIPADPGALDITAPSDPVTAWAAGATVVHPGAASAARRWPVERFATVARRELAAGRRVVVTGSVAERPAAQRLAVLAGLDPGSVLAGTTGLLPLISVIARAGRLVSGDTGVAHIATAVGTPSVVLFGPVSPEEWGPPPDRIQHLALWAGRRGDPHGDRLDAGLAEITVGDVLAALDQLDARTSTATIGSAP